MTNIEIFGEMKMKKLLTTVILTLTIGSANAFFGNDSNTNGYFINDTDGTFDGRGHGKGYGRADMEGNFSMTINASGSGNSKMNADIDGDTNSRFNGVNDNHYASAPHYYGYKGN